MAKVKFLFLLMHYPKWVYLRTLLKREYKRNLPINLIFRFPIKEVHFVWTPFSYPEYIHYNGKYRRGVSYGAGKSKYAGILEAGALEAKEQRLTGGYHIILFKLGEETLKHIDSPAPTPPFFIWKTLKGA